MPSSFNPTEVEFLRRQAKRLSRDAHVRLSQAQDQIAIANGYSNWSLMIRHRRPVPDAVQPTRSANMPLVFARSSEQMRLALHKVREPRGRWSVAPAGRDAVRSRVEDLRDQFVSATNAVDFAVDYMACLLSVPRLRVTTAATVGWEMRCWLPYAALRIGPGDNCILVNRRYKPVGQANDDFVAYEDFTHLHLRLTEAQRLVVSHGPIRENAGYLFNDGCPPYHSRVDAKQYLERLQRLQTMLRGQG